MFCTRRFKIQIFEKRGFQNLIAMETSNRYATKCHNKLLPAQCSRQSQDVWCWLL